MPAKRAKHQVGPLSTKSARSHSVLHVTGNSAATVDHEGTLANKDQKAKSYPLPPELLAIEHEGEPPCTVWPKRSLMLKYWALDGGPGRDDMIRDVLLARGWTNGLDPCDPSDTNDLPLVFAGCGSQKVPRRALYIVGEDGKEPKVYLDAFSKLPDPANRFRFTMFCGSEVACYKSNTAKMLRGEPFCPETYVLPAEKEQLLAAEKRARARKEPCYWVGKPKNLWAGKGLVVSASAASVVADNKQGSSSSGGVVQRYIDQPLLIGGYKSHLRVYMLMTAVRPEVRAYIHKELCVMFTTMPYTLDPKFLGGTKKGTFEPRIHLSNYDINARENNMHNYLADKPEVGKGSLWTTNQFESWLRKNRPDISIDGLWRQLRLIGRKAAQSIGSHRSLKQHATPPNLQHELFGLDVMLDARGKAWLLETNNSPGLEYCASHFPDGAEDPTAAASDAVTWSVIEDRFKLLGFDGCDKGNASNYLRVV